MKLIKKSVVSVLLAVLLVGGGATTAYAASVQDQVLASVNQQRSAANLPPLSRDPKLDAAAQEWAQTMSRTGRFEHSSNTWRAERISSGWNSHGENIAYGQRTAASVMSAWMGSDGHRKNILRSSYTRLGVGYVASGNFWVQIFAGYASDSKPAGPPMISPSPVGRTAGSAREGSPLTAVTGTWASNTRFSYQWYLNGQVVAGATGQKFTPGASAIGKRASAAVTGNLTGFSPTTRMTDLSGYIQALPQISPAPIGRPAGSAKVGSAMTAVPGTWAAGTTLTYQWYVNGAAVSGQTGTRFIPRPQDIDARASVKVVGSKAGFATTVRMSTASGLIQPQLPYVNPAPTGRVGGSARAKLPLSAVPGTWASGTVLSYQWYVNGVPVAGETGAKFIPSASAVNGRATVSITGALKGFSPTTRMSTTSGIIQAPLPEITPAPIGRPAGSARVGSALTAVPGAWASQANLSYQWFVNGSAIAGATDGKFTPTASHVGGRASVSVTGVLPGFSPTVRVSTPSGIIQPKA